MQNKRDRKCCRWGGSVTNRMIKAGKSHWKKKLHVSQEFEGGEKGGMVESNSNEISFIGAE